MDMRLQWTAVIDTVPTHFNMPQPVYDYISELWGESTTGFKDPSAGG